LYQSRSLLSKKEERFSLSSFFGTPEEKDSNNQMQMSGGNLLAAGWTAATPYASHQG